jgi:hypothetical protein
MEIGGIRKERTGKERMESEGLDVMKTEDCIYREIVNGDMICERIAVTMQLLIRYYSHSVGYKTAERSLYVNACASMHALLNVHLLLLCSHLFFFGKYTQFLRSLCFSPGHPAGLTQV